MREGYKQTVKMEMKLFRTVSLLFVIGAIFQQCGSVKTGQPSSNGALTSAQEREGWKLLFDGTTTNGWHTYGKQSVGSAWKVSDGNLFLDHIQSEGRRIEGGGDIVTNEEYENFDLKLEWKISPGGNSGIVFYVKDEPSKYQYIWNTGMEMQVLDNDRHPDGKLHKHRTGDLYDLIASSSETARPVGEWNQAEIISNKGKLEFYLNNIKVVSTTLWDENWNRLVAGSKFGSMPGFGTFRKGHIGLQDHENTVWYKNIMIRKL
jgi:hypothetical protein